MNILLMFLGNLVCFYVGMVYARRQTAYWKRQAMANARARLTKDAACNVEKQEINCKAGREIARLNAQVEDLTAELQRVRNINRNLLKQLDKRKEADDGQI